MRTLFAALAAICLLLGRDFDTSPVPAHAAGTVEVTSAGDEGASGGAVCPHATLCTLRRAIEVANADASGSPFVITFAPSNSPFDIAVGNTPLPNITRDGVAIDGAGATVMVRNASTSLSATSNGLTVTGASFVLRSTNVRGFPGACVAVTGANATIGVPAAGNSVGGCGTGIAVSSAGAILRANLVGFTPGGSPDPVETGVVIAAGNGQVGGPPTVSGAGNVIGNATTGVFVGSGTPGAFSGTTIERNTFGKAPGGSAAPLGRAIVLSQPSSQATVAANDITNAGEGIVVAADTDGVSVTRNEFVANSFSNIGLMAIDLGLDGITNPNDAGDPDTGPNQWLNHPMITRATQTRVTGTACAGCGVQLYVAHHEPGGQRDYGTVPLTGTTVTADGSGAFALDNPPVSAGDWLVALATDTDGNTSEFGPSARVGAGSVLCGNVQLRAGWNHVGYFGAEPVSLLGAFAPVPSGAVTAIYRYVDGAGEFERWFAATPVGRTLTSVEPGESYWFYAESAATLPGGFSLSFPLPVQLDAGWNDFVYLGATASAADALSSLGADFDDLYRYDATASEWLRYGGSEVPAWARDFDTVEACGVYQLRLDAPATLTPLQP